MHFLLLEGVSNYIKTILGPWAYPPLASVITLILATLIPLISYSITRLIVGDIEKYKSLQREIMAINREIQEELRRVKDPKLISKKKMERLNELQSKTLKYTTYNMIITLPIFWLIWIIFLNIFGSEPMVYFPFLNTILPFYWWYFICAFGMGTIIYKLLGLQSP